jgi:cytochrome c oxidase subunit 2
VRLAVAGALAGGGLLALAPAALAGVISPESGGSPNADEIHLLYWIALIVSIPIFVLVEGLLVFSLFRHRFRRGGPSAEQVRGNTPLEIGWTVGATSVVILLAVITFYMLGSISTPPPSDPGALRAGAGQLYAQAGQPPLAAGEKPLEIGVNGQQYLWRYDYPGLRGRLFAYHELVVPTGTTIVLSITSQDVIHSWWIPKLGGKKDAVPGHFTSTWFKIARPGVFRGQCAELCGEGHTAMTASVRALPPAEFRRWATGQAAAIRASQEALIETRRKFGTNQ